MLSFFKKKRIVDEQIIKTFKKKRCAACRFKGEGVVGHHIKTVGAGGPDVNDNLIPLCRKCHHDIHYMGAKMFSTRYPRIKRILELKGWYWFQHRHLNDRL